MALALLAVIVLGLIVRGVLNITAEKRLQSAVHVMKAEGRHVSVHEPHPFNRFFGTMLLIESLGVLHSVLMKAPMDELAYQTILDELSKQQPQDTLKLSLRLEQAMVLEEYISYFRGNLREKPLARRNCWACTWKRQKKYQGPIAWPGYFSPPLAAGFGKSTFE